ncbi:MAG: restriction endonuclease subunit S [Clostridia bacterium]
MPADWATSNLLGIADYINGLAMQKYRPQENEDSFPVLKIKELRQGSCDSSSDRCSKYIKSDYIVYDGDVIFSWSGSLMLDFWSGNTCGLNQHLFKVTSSKYDKWFYYFWTDFHLQKFIAIAEAKATTMGHIKRGELETSEVVIPDSAIYVQLTNTIQPMLDLVVARRIENRKLAQLRDTLLPRLMSGEIDASQVEI